MSIVAPGRRFPISFLADWAHGAGRESGANFSIVEGYSSTMLFVLPVIGRSSHGFVPVDPRVWGSNTYLLVVLGLLALHVFLQVPGASAERMLGEVFLVLPAAILYFLVRGLTHADPDRAIGHAETLVGFEQRVGLHLEPQLQAAIIEHPRLVRLANWIYVWGHWPMIFIVLVWLWVRYPDSYPVYRNAMLISGAIGIVIFGLYPVAPPRLVPSLELVDTVTQESRAYRLLQPPALANQFAAMPSLHFGWNLIIGLAIAMNSSRLLGRLFGLLLPVAMFAAIILTANHYILDGLVGGIVALTGLGLARMLTPARQECPNPSEAIRNRRAKIENG